MHENSVHSPPWFFFHSKQKPKPSVDRKALKDPQAPSAVSSLSPPRSLSSSRTGLSTVPQTTLFSAPFALALPPTRPLLSWLPPFPPSSLHPNVTSSEKPALISLFNAVPTIHPFSRLYSSPQPFSPYFTFFCFREGLPHENMSPVRARISDRHQEESSMSSHCVWNFQ